MLAFNWQRQVPSVRCSNAICDSRSDLLRPDVTSSHNTTRYLDSGVEVCLNFAEVCLSSTARSSCPLASLKSAARVEKGIENEEVFSRLFDASAVGAVLRASPGRASRNNTR